MNRQQIKEAIENFDSKFEQNYKDYWKKLLTTDGKFDEQKIKNELRDLCFIYDQVGEVYLYITEGQLSKATYYAEDIKTAFDDAVTKAAKEETKELIEEQKQIIRRGTI